ncbi:MAG: hypothetical protein QME93_12120 [Bacillota bacterium]|nr:hypothetical protein [Bacillota bacterium]
MGPMSRMQSLVVLLVVLFTMCLLEVEVAPAVGRVVARQFRFPPEVIAFGYAAGAVISFLGVSLAMVCRSPVRTRYDRGATLATAFLGLLLAGIPIPLVGRVYAVIHSQTLGIVLSSSVLRTAGWILFGGLLACSLLDWRRANWKSPVD